MGMTHELKSYITQETAFETADVTANTDGVIIDTQGFCNVLLVAIAGGLAGGTFAARIEHGDDSGLSDAAVVPNDDLVGERNNPLTPDIDMDFDAATDDNLSKSVNYIGKKRYLRLSYDPTTPSGVNDITGVAIKVDAMNV